MRILGSWLHRTPRDRVVLSLSLERVLLARATPDWVFAEERCQGQADWARAIAALIQRTASQGARVSVLLEAGLYQQVQIERPEVPDEELAGALPWAVKDFVSEPVTQLGLDYYSLPTNPAARPRLAVVGVNRQRLRAIADAVNAVARLERIGTEELALADLPGVAPQMVLLLFQLPERDLQLLAICEGRLCFSRQLRGFTALTRQPLATLDSLIADNLLLELQRSMDYLVAQLKLPAVSQLYVAIDTPDPAAVAQYLQQNLAMTVHTIDPPAGAQGRFWLPLVGHLQQEWVE